jgi:(2S)-methylsuccinyl-CoA dehydrogenase
MNATAPSLYTEALLDRADAAVRAARRFAATAQAAVRKDVTRPDGRVDGEAANRQQRRAHGLAWIATYVETLAQTAR